ncbi:hypothetical protein HNQ02_000273 [Flavobacterium sp. 7E]|uniref:hypothetical protein n=1 Tax=Flavobacterium sp. 7E TaxID=2735898 RepID=UPI0015701B7A|nr:hypothetical protein [Flavobacterium sp. 7E]NRS87373.1 hypothetical protein [Flavobacterium sp. 7E]
MSNRTIKITVLLIVALFIISCKKEIVKDAPKLPKDSITVVETIQEPEQEEEEIVGEKIQLEEGNRDFLKKLIYDEIGNKKYSNLEVTKSPYQVNFDNDGDSYTVSFSIGKKFDFNKDGIMDYVINRDSEGMLGGSVNSNQEYLYYIMKDETNYSEAHSILGYAPFSYNIIDDAKFVGAKFKINITQNYRTYETENLKSTSLSFIYKNGNLYEESYLSDCKLAKLKSKTIFTNIPEVEKRVRSIEMHNYTETIEEIYKNGDTLITASLDGCDNLNLNFDKKYKISKNQIITPDFKKKEAIQFLRFLRNSTQFSKEILIAERHYSIKPIGDKFVEAIKGYSFRILVEKDSQNKNELRVLFQMTVLDNPNQLENWEVATRQKKKI